jgi:hypothetical protein
MSSKTGQGGRNRPTAPGCPIDVSFQFADRLTQRPQRTRSSQRVLNTKSNAMGVWDGLARRIDACTGQVPAPTPGVASQACISPGTRRAQHSPGSRPQEQANCSAFRAYRAATPRVRSPMIIAPDTEAGLGTLIDHPLDVDGHGGVTSGKGESQILVAVNNRPEAGAPLPVQYETSCGLLRLTV